MEQHGQVHQMLQEMEDQMVVMEVHQVLHQEEPVKAPPLVNLKNQQVIDMLVVVEGYMVGQALVLVELVVEEMVEKMVLLILGVEEAVIIAKLEVLKLQVVAVLLLLEIIENKFCIKT